MLTPEQIAVIEKIPAEGKEPFLLSENERKMRAITPFIGKREAADGEAVAKILIGAPGSGKSRHASLLMENEVLVSYDEGGAIYDIEAYKEELKAISKFKGEFESVSRDSLQARRELWQKYQSDSQSIRAMTLKKALHEGYSIVVDTTSSSGGTQHLINALRQLPFREIRMQGAYAPFDISRERVEGRPRPTSGFGDLVMKRIGAMNFIPEYAGQVDSFDFYHNPLNNHEPVKAFSLAAGKTVAANARVINAMNISIAHDSLAIKKYLLEIKDDPSKVAPENIDMLDVDAVMEKYLAAKYKVQMFMQRVGRHKPGISFSFV